MSEAHDLYGQLASRILDLWNAREEDKALPALDRALRTASDDGDAARESLFLALLSDRIERSPRAMLRWLDIVLKRFALHDSELPDSYRKGIATYVSVHLDRYDSFVEQGTIERVKPELDPEQFDPKWGTVNWRKFDDDEVRARLAVFNLYSPGGPELLNDHLDGLDADRTEQDLENGLAMAQSWEGMNPALLPEDSRIQQIAERGLSRLLAEHAILQMDLTELVVQAAGNPGRFALLVKLAALCWLGQRLQYEQAREASPPNVFWPAMAAACRLRTDCAFSTELMNEIGHTPAAPLLLTSCDARTAYNFSRDVQFD
ncbi:hypothetical protein [Parachitinimonas caeni]|uniref:Uncharacterized protein n=1 Tax=Parachitinimonas caeni TaxID=3031301 RepID=A0ABT7DW76_9NEIS|nr:hypothetical protein [Parachitinimonas caeni]MDK2124303.1 hypothetical protein [Parachitinimonas caeni]